MGVVRRQDRLETALTDFASLRHDVEKASVSGNKVYNMEFNTHLDTLNMLDVSVMAAGSALQREETRGAHTREDFPKQRDEYGLFNTFMWRAATECRFLKRRMWSLNTNPSKSVRSTRSDPPPVSCNLSGEKR